MGDRQRATSVPKAKSLALRPHQEMTGFAMEPNFRGQRLNTSLADEAPYQAKCLSVSW